MAHKKQQQQHGKVHPQQTTRTASKHGRVNPKWKDKARTKQAALARGEGRRGGNDVVVETMVKQQVEVEKHKRDIFFSHQALCHGQKVSTLMLLWLVSFVLHHQAGRFDRFTQCRGFLPSCLIKFYANKRLVPSRKRWWYDMMSEEVLKQSRIRLKAEFFLFTTCSLVGSH